MDLCMDACMDSHDVSASRLPDCGLHQRLTRHICSPFSAAHVCLIQQCMPYVSDSAATPLPMLAALLKGQAVLIKLMAPRHIVVHRDKILELLDVCVSRLGTITAEEIAADPDTTVALLSACFDTLAAIISKVGTTGHNQQRGQDDSKAPFPLSIMRPLSPLCLCECGLS